MRCTLYREKQGDGPTLLFIGLKASMCVSQLDFLPPDQPYGVTRRGPSDLILKSIQYKRQWYFSSQVRLVVLRRKVYLTKLGHWILFVWVGIRSKIRITLPHSRTHPCLTGMSQMKSFTQIEYAWLQGIWFHIDKPPCTCISASQVEILLGGNCSTIACGLREARDS